ncbi:MAG: CsbD family protein [Anaerolineae bacterium]|nr:CsbD family protein [Anaerolineae bacterium]
MKDKWAQISGQWKQFAGEAKKKWNELTDDELAKVNGDRKRLVSIVQQRYGIAKKAAEKQVDAWANALKV